MDFLGRALHSRHLHDLHTPVGARPNDLVQGPHVGQYERLQLRVVSQNLGHLHWWRGVRVAVPRLSCTSLTERSEDLATYYYSISLQLYNSAIG